MSKEKPEVKTQEEAEDLARELFNEGRLEEVIQLCQRALDVYPRAFELWKIFGAALGGSGRTKEARRAFLSALEIVPGDGTAVANYITSCFHDGDIKSACEAIELYFDELPNDAQSVVLNSLAESIQSGVVSEDQLPPVILSLFEDESEVLSNLEMDSDEGDGGHYNLNDEERDEVMKCIQEIEALCQRAKDSVASKNFSVRSAEEAFNFVEDKLVEIAVILDGALE